MNLEPEYSFGSSGSSLGKFMCPRGLAVQPFTNNLIVADNWNHRIQVVSVDNKTCHACYKIGGGVGGNDVGTKNGQLKNPYGLCVDSTSSIVVADFYNHRVQLFDSSGRFMSTFGSRGNSSYQLETPYDICYLSPHFSSSFQTTSNSSLLLITDYWNKRLCVCDVSSNNYSHKPVAQINLSGLPETVCTDMNGFVYVCYRVIYKNTTHTIGMIDVRDPIMGFDLIQTIIGNFSAMTINPNNVLVIYEDHTNCLQFFE